MVDLFAAYVLSKSFETRFIFIAPLAVRVRGN